MSQSKKMRKLPKLFEALRRKEKKKRKLETVDDSPSPSASSSSSSSKKFKREAGELAELFAMAAQDDPDPGDAKTVELPGEFFIAIPKSESSHSKPRCDQGVLKSSKVVIRGGSARSPLRMKVLELLKTLFLGDSAAADRMEMAMSYRCVKAHPTSTTAMEFAYRTRWNTIKSNLKQTPDFIEFLSAHPDRMEHIWVVGSLFESEDFLRVEQR